MEVVDKNVQENLDMLRDAKLITQIPLDFEPVRAEYENRLIQKYCQMEGETFDQSEIEQLIEEYTRARLHDCLLRGDLK